MAAHCRIWALLVHLQLFFSDGPVSSGFAPCCRIIRLLPKYLSRLLGLWCRAGTAVSERVSALYVFKCAATGSAPHCIARHLSANRLICRCSTIWGV